MNVRANVVFVGAYGVGKTSAIHRMLAPDTPLDQIRYSKPTVGFDRFTYISSNNINIEFWDTSGDPIYEKLNEIIVNKCDVVVSCREMGSPRPVIDFDIEYIIYVQTKCDLFKQGDDHFISSVTREGLDELKGMLVEKIKKKFFLEDRGRKGVCYLC